MAHHPSAFRILKSALLSASLALAVTLGVAPAQALAAAPPTEATSRIFSEGQRLNQQELSAVQEGVQAKSTVSAKSVTRTPVYRFYNSQTGAHFFTISVSERDHIQATMPQMAYEGIAFEVSSTASSGLDPVYRFYNQSSGVHFYTISESEKNHLVANAPFMQFEGVAYYASKLAGTGQRALYRFYVASGGFHFYTVSESEKSYLVANVPNYQYEGIGYYVLGANEAPSVALTSPAAGASFTAPASITLSAQAEDTDGSIASVAFYNGATLLGTDTAAPYSFDWANVAAGSYSLTARAVDNNGATSTSAAVAVTVNAPANTAPTVSLTAPAAGASFTAPATVNITADAADSDGSIASVAFYNGATLLSTDTSAPYSYSWSNVAAGSYSLTARATDDDGEISTSAAVSITVDAPQNQAPTVSLTSPAAGASFTAPASITLSADATDSDGTVASVAFYNGTTLLGTDTTAPYSFSWSNVAVGSYSITAVATDDDGAVTTSAAVSVTVGVLGAETITYIHTDVSGSPLAATNANGNVVWKENYRAYGERQLEQPGSEGQGQWFHGKQADATTGLQYFGARYYDPAVGRFMGVDPVGFQEGNLHSFNRYAYGNNNPVRYLDPDGNSAEEVKVWVANWWSMSLAGFQSATPGETALKVLEGSPAGAGAIGGAGFFFKGGAGVAKGVSATKGIPGIDKPFRAANALHPPNAAVVEKMNSLRICSGTDCSEIASALRATAGEGRILRVTGQGGSDLRLMEYGKIDGGFKYHEVFTDGKYIYDPRLSNSAVPKGDWTRMIQDLNPGAVVK